MNTENQMKINDEIRSIDPVVELINSLPRKKLRYFMIRRQTYLASGVEEPLDDNYKLIIDYFEQLAEFTNWKDFNNSWDIGISENDHLSKKNRPYDYKLFNNPQSNILSTVPYAHRVEEYDIMMTNMKQMESLTNSNS